MVGIKPMLAALAFVAVALSGCTADGATFSEPAPQWRAGYAWSYNTDIQGTWEEDENGERDNGTWDESYQEIVKVLNTTQVLDGRDVYLVANQFGEWGNNLVAIRHDDLSPVWVEWDVCRDADCLDALELEAYSDHEEVPRMYDFPLAAGSSWADTISEEDFELKIQFSNKVTGTERMMTELGEVDTIVIQRTVRLQNVEALLDMLREELEDEGLRVIRLDGDFSVRITEHYAPLYQNVLRSVAVENSRFLLEAEYEGERFTESETSMSTATTTLRGADLTAGPEQSLAQIADLLQGRVSLDDPAGSVVAEADYILGIDVERGEINVAAEETLRYTASIDGELPADHQLQWTVMDSVGAVVASGTGTQFEATPTLPGSYAVILRSTAAGTTVQSAFETGIGHYRAELTSVCGLVEAAGQGVPSDCAEQPIPVRPGILSLDIQATTGSPADGANVATIRLTDSVGSTIDASNEGDAKHLQMSDMLYAYAVSGQDWDLDWYQTAGAGEAQVVFDVDLTYGPMELGPVGVAVEATPIGLYNWHQADVSFL